MFKNLSMNNKVFWNQFASNLCWGAAFVLSYYMLCLETGDYVRFVLYCVCAWACAISADLYDRDADNELLKGSSSNGGK